MHAAAPTDIARQRACWQMPQAPLASWQALRDAVTGTGQRRKPDGRCCQFADALAAGLNDTANAADGAGGAARNAGAAAAAGAEQRSNRMGSGHRVARRLCRKARDIGGDIGQTLVGAFQAPRTRWPLRQIRQAGFPRPRHLA